MREPLLVSPAEAGQKLLQFLSRRFDLPRSVFHRWIRTGQVRINGGRAKAFDRVEENDEVRVPPFAFDERPDEDAGKSALFAAKPLPPIAAETDEIVVFVKPAGLPVHPGSGHADSLTARIAKAYAGAGFAPTPVHRLDKDVSGLLLAGKTYRAVRRLSDALAARDGSVVKEYLAWAAGDCPWEEATLLVDRLEKRATEGDPKERVRVRKGGAEGEGREKAKEAVLTVRRVAKKNGASLLLIRLRTGRTHQIRAQLAARGFPLLGDVKYGGPRLEGGILLHAARLILGGEVYEAPPDWKGARRASKLPPPSFLDEPRLEAKPRLP